MNPAAEAVFGFSADEVIGQSLDLSIPERLRPALESVPSGHRSRAHEARKAGAGHPFGTQERSEAIRRSELRDRAGRCR